MLKNNRQLFVYPPMMALSLYATFLGLMIPQLIDTYNLNLKQVGLFSGMQGVGMIVALILCFCLFSAFNTTRISTIAMFLFALLMVLVGINTSITAFYVLFFFIGISQVTIDTLSNTVIRETSGRNESLWLGLLHSLWALSGAVGPFLALAIGGSYKQAFICLGVYVVVSAILYVVGLNQWVKAPMMQNKNNFGGLLKLLRMFKIKCMPSMVIINVFSCLVQNTYILFIAEYMQQTYSFELGGAVCLSSIFFGMLIGRTLFSLFADKIPVLKTMTISNAVAVVCFAGVFLTNSLIITIVLICLGSLLTAMNFPALVLEAHKLAPHDVSSASSLIYIGLVASIVFAPPIIGFIGDAIGLRWALLITAFGLLPVVALSAVSIKHFDVA